MSRRSVFRRTQPQTELNAQQSQVYNKAECTEGKQQAVNVPKQLEMKNESDVGLEKRILANSNEKTHSEDMSSLPAVYLNQVPDITKPLNPNDSSHDQNGEVDWSTYPLFRLNDIVKLKEEELKKAMSDLDVLVTSMRNSTEEQDVQLLMYIEKEQTAITKHLKYLQATARLEKLLSGPSKIDLSKLQGVYRSELAEKPEYPIPTSVEACIVSSRTAGSVLMTTDRSEESRQPLETQLHKSDAERQFMQSKKRISLARRNSGVIPNSQVKEFVVFSDGSKAQRRKLQEQEKAKMKTRAAKLALKKENEKKKLVLDKKKATRERLEKREQLRKQWEAERLERISNAERVAQVVSTSERFLSSFQILIGLLVEGEKTSSSRNGIGINETKQTIK